MKVEIESVADGKRWTFDQREVSLGRDPQCDVRLTADAFLMVSRRHATVLATPEGELWLEDQNSFNGTQLNGRRISRERLQPGDVFRLGDDGPEFRVSLPGRGATGALSATQEMGSASATHMNQAATQFSPGSRPAPPTQVSGGFATTSRSPAPSIAKIPTAIPKTAGGMQAPTGYGVAATAASAAPPSSYEDLSPEEEAMLERKIAVMRNLLVLVILLCIALGGVVVYQGQEIRKTRETLNAMQRQAENAVGQFMPSLNTRLNRFDSRLDEFQGKMDSMDNNMKRAEDRFVQRMDVEMPRIMDRYLQMKANELQRGAKVEVKTR
jgi:hypothetical protein